MRSGCAAASSGFFHQTYFRAKFCRRSASRGIDENSFASATFEARRPQLAGLRLDDVLSYSIYKRSRKQLIISGIEAPENASLGHQASVTVMVFQPSPGGK